MKSRLFVLILAGVGLVGTGATVASCPPPPVQQELVSRPGFVQPETPGSGVVGVEMVPAQKVRRIVGANPDLNRVTVLRTFLPKPSGAPPRAIVILVPGFLGGAQNCSPLAKQLVRRFNGNLEVWGIDRRPNQVEDRRGALHGRARFDLGDMAGFVDAI